MRKVIVMSRPHRFLVGDRVSIQDPPYQKIVQAKVTGVPTRCSIEMRSLYWWERMWDKLRGGK